MIISYQWLMDYLPEAIPVDELSEILTSIGLEVEAVETSEAVKGSLQGLVIGQVLSCVKHPNADKLSLTTVDIGNGEPLKIVCGAPNVAAGQRVVVAPVGTTVHPSNGTSFAIKKAKIRGEESQGMICAEDEIGLGESHAGIMVLPADAPVGMPAKDYFKIPEADYAIHIGLTPNRSDAMSHMGVARDVCAYLSHHRRRPFRIHAPEHPLPEKTASRTIGVTIHAKEACPRYAGLTITDVKVGPSPEWLQRRLKTIGVRSINNVVDVTNYVLHEFGQPLHAFDADKIGGGEIHVRFLAGGTPFMALDGREIKLRDTDLMICDQQNGMCIAGVFGGQNSGVSNSTTSIFLESAWFNPGSVRRTSLAHGLRTDAATHFEKGVDINNVIPALIRAANLIAELAGGAIASDITDIYPEHMHPVKVDVTYRQIEQLSGKSYAPKDVKSILLALGFGIEHETEAGMTLLVPSNKTDVSQPADIVEEIVRIDGLDQIDIPKKLNISLSQLKPTDRGMRDDLADLLCGLGFQEIVTNSIINSKYYPDRTDLVLMLNSLSSELNAMRPAMLESGLEVIQYNCNRRNEDLALFEFGNVYRKSGDQYIEQPILALWITGNVRRQHWNQKAEPAALYHLKGVLTNLMRRSGISSGTEHLQEETLIWKHRNELLAEAFRVSDTLLDQFGLKQDVFFLQINWNLWYKTAKSVRTRFREVPRHPAVQRDLAIVLDKHVSYQQVKEVTEKLRIDALQHVELFDVFESEKLGADKKSYALSYTFQLNDRTMTEAEIEQMMQQLMQTYKTSLQAQIRE